MYIQGQDPFFTLFNLINAYISDVFKISLDKIEVNPVYETRDVNTAFVECLKDAMSTDLSLDSVLYVACEEQPFIEDNGCFGNESTFYILAGTHYLWVFIPVTIFFVDVVFIRISRSVN